MFRWELAAPTAAQLLSLLVTRMDALLSSQVLAIVQSHAATFLSLAATEYSFHHVRPSLMVAASILTAIHGLCPAISSQTGFQNLLCNMIGAHLHDLVLLVRQLEVRVSGWISTAITTTSTTTSTTATSTPQRQKQPVSGHEDLGLYKRQKTKQSLQAFCGYSQNMGMDIS